VKLLLLILDCLKVGGDPAVNCDAFAHEEKVS